MNDLKNTVAIITGASRGIGRAVALALADEGVNLCLVSRSKDALNEVASEAEKKGVKAISLAADLSKPSEAGPIVVKTIKELGRLDILINNAGTYSSALTGEANLEDWDKVINLNLRSMMHMTRHALPHIEKNESGGIINIASVAGKMTYQKGGVYSATKHGVLGFTGCLYEDVREKNIKVCAICPGFVNTDMVRNPKLDSTKMIQPKDIAKTILFVLKFPDTGCPTEIVIRPQQSPYIT